MLTRLLAFALSILVVLCGSMSVALAQGSVLQAGPFAAGHPLMYLNGGSGAQAQAQDAGPAGGGAIGLGLSEILQVNRNVTGTGPFGSHNCLYDNPVSSGNYHYLCLDANGAGGGLLAFGAGGSASPLPLNFIVNGVTYTFASLPLLPLPPAQGGTGTTTVFTQGSVVFAGASGIYAQDNANFFWDFTHHRLGLINATPTAPLDIGGNTSGNLQAVLTRGVTDPNFQLQVLNGVAGASQLLSQAIIGLQYVGSGLGPSIQFLRGPGNTDGFLALAPGGHPVLVGPGAVPAGAFNVKTANNSSIVFFGEGLGSPSSLSNNAVTLILRDYSNSHSAAISIDAVNSAGALVQNAFEMNPGFVSWDAGHEQGDIDFNSFINGTLQGVMAWNAGCNTFNVGCVSPTNPAFLGDGNQITDLGYPARRWHVINGITLNLGTGGATYGLFNSTSSGTTYDSGGHQFLTGGMQVGAAPTGGNRGAGTINLAGDIYKNNTAYTNPDYVFEKAYTGNIVRFANNEGAGAYKGTLTIEQAESYAKKHLRLPGMTDEAAGAFARADRVLEKLEEAYLHIFDLNKRLAILEAKHSKHCARKGSRC